MKQNFRQPERRNFIGDLFLRLRLYLVIAALVLIYFLSYFIPELYVLATAALLLFLLLLTADYIFLFSRGDAVSLHRELPERFSLGDDNTIAVHIRNGFPVRIRWTLIDEFPDQFQDRTWHREGELPAGAETTVSYTLRPLSRGVHTFHSLLLYARTGLGFLERRVRVTASAEVKVYPSFVRHRAHMLLATTDSPITGARRRRVLGNSAEFEKIKEYVQGDDVRNINWKASARRGDMMVNTFSDARQQQIWCVIDKGRNMKSPFNGLTLLDHSINAALALLQVALMRGDRAGLITFSNRMGDIIPAERHNGQMHRLNEALYRQTTDFFESDYEQLLGVVHRNLKGRSLLLLFTSFDSPTALERQAPYLKGLAARHLLCVIFFQNTLLRQLNEQQPDTTEGIYIKTIADRFAYEKRQTVKALRQMGILSILTTPESLTVDVINKYLELKARQMV